MAQLAIQQIGDGADPAFSAVGGAGDTVAFDDRTFLEYRNTDAATRTVTVAIPGTTHGTAVPDLAVVVPATTGVKRIKLTPDMVDPTTGNIALSYSATANLTVAALRV